MLVQVDRDTYARVKASVPEWDGKIREVRKGRLTLYYVRQSVVEESTGAVVALHDDAGVYWADPGRVAGG